MQNTIKLKYNRNNSFVATKVFHSITKTATCNSEKFCTPSPLWRGKIVIFFRIRCYFTLSTLLNSINNYPRKYLSPKRYCRTHIEHQSCIQLKTPEMLNSLSISYIECFQTRIFQWIFWYSICKTKHGFGGRYFVGWFFIIFGILLRV